MYTLEETRFGFTANRWKFSSFAAALDYFLDLLEDEKKDSGLYDRMSEFSDEYGEFPGFYKNGYVEILNVWEITNTETGSNQQFPYLKRCYENGVVTVKML